MSRRPSNGPVVLQAVQLTRSYGQTKAVNRVDVAVSAGQVCALVGLNGAGNKSISPRPTGAALCVPAGMTAHAGGSLCGDLIRVSVRVDGDRRRGGRVRSRRLRRFHAPRARRSVTLVEGELLLDAARVGTTAVVEELGGLSPGKLHAADLAADALHRALGVAAREARVPLSDRTLVAMSGGRRFRCGRVAGGRRGGRR